jgi:hypothetical protein
MTLTQKLRIYSAKWKEGKWIFKWKGCGRKWLSRNLKYYPSICLEGVRNTTKNLSQDSRSPGQDLNPETLEYEAGVLSTRQRLRYSRMQRTGTFGTIENPPTNALLVRNRRRLYLTAQCCCTRAVWTVWAPGGVALYRHKKRFLNGRRVEIWRKNGFGLPR